MTVRTGIDLLDIDRLQKVIDRHGNRFLQRIYTERELSELKDNTASLAARFAAKEAVSKALGTGIGAVNWLEIEILRGPARQPVLTLHGKAAEQAAAQGLHEWSLSLSHTSSQAIAIVVASD